jgi:hypothetical protein
MPVNGDARRIAVLFHEKERATPLSSYIVSHLADFWREDGFEVEFIFGVGRQPPADLLFVHVNLSVVPSSYLAFAARYPRTVNGHIQDIRKSVISKNLLQPGNTWDGPVIVKSDLNFGGQPERVINAGWLHRRSRLWRRTRRWGARATGNLPTFESWKDYRVYDRLSDVPEWCFSDPTAVVERFVPEFEDGLFRLRMYQFLGDRSVCTRLASNDPLMKAGISESVEHIDPHPDVARWRTELRMDYGKFDYLASGGAAVLIDANKTVGASRHLPSDELRALRRHLAEGLYSYLP